MGRCGLGLFLGYCKERGWLMKSHAFLSPTALCICSTFTLDLLFGEVGVVDVQPDIVEAVEVDILVDAFAELVE